MSVVYIQCNSAKYKDKLPATALLLDKTTKVTLIDWYVDPRASSVVYLCTMDGRPGKYMLQEWEVIGSTVRSIRNRR